MIHKVYVYDKVDGALIGSGWLPVNEDGTQYQPMLYDIAGVPMPTGWYHLVLADETKLIVMPNKMVQ